MEGGDKKIKSVLMQYGELRFKDLKDLTGLSSPTLSKWLKRLEKNREVMRIVIPEKEGVYYKLIDPQFKKYKLISHWIITNSYKQGLYISRKFNQDPILSILWAYGFILIGTLQTLKKIMNEKEFRDAKKIILFSTTNRLLQDLEKINEDVFLNDEELKKIFLELLNTPPEKIDKVVEELNKDLKRYHEKFVESSEKGGKEKEEKKK